MLYKITGTMSLDNREEPDVMGVILKRIIEIIYNERTVITERIR